MTRIRRSAVLAALLCGGAPGRASASGGAVATAGPPFCRKGEARLARVDLFFGAGSVSAKAWARFVAQVVTPRFPAGLTSLDGQGQWRSPHGLAAEPARILVIFYRADRASDRSIEVIRSIYKARFAQTSVLRADSEACVGF